MGAQGPGPSGRTLAEGPARRRAAALAGHTGDHGTAAALAEDNDPKVRAVALGALARRRCLPAARLVRAAGDPEPAVRRRAAELIAAAPRSGDDHHGTHTAAADAAASADEVAIDGALKALLDDREPTVVEVAAWATGERHAAEPDRRGPATAPTWVVERLSTLATGHDDALVREAAVAALGSVGDPRGLPSVLAGCADKATVRRRAVLALAPFDGPEVDAALARAAADRDWQVRQAAEDLLDPDR
jgi:HEAT repeat protein